MEFEEEHEEEQEEEEEDDSHQPHQINLQPHPAARNGGVAAARYRECLKNHAVSSGGHAVDGCGEFMPAADDPLKCAACTCHRNFHRKEHQPYFTPAAAPPPPPAAIYPPQFFHHRPPPPGFFHHRPLALPPAEHDHRSPSGSGKKRFRTKFTAAQKEKMLEFADSVGWKIQKHDDEAVERFCSELQISRQVLKVWMHNNKNTAGGRSRMP